MSDKFSDPDGDPLSYRAASSSESVVRATVRGSTVMVVPSSGGTATVTVTATDVGSSNTSAAQQFQVTVTGVDYDTDDDGLIEIRTPAQLDAVRHDLDGDGDPGGESAYAAAFAGADVGMGCGAAAARGTSCWPISTSTPTAAAAPARPTTTGTGERLVADRDHRGAVLGDSRGQRARRTQPVHQSPVRRGAVRGGERVERHPPRGAGRRGGGRRRRRRRAGRQQRRFGGRQLHDGRGLRHGGPGGRSGRKKPVHGNGPHQLLDRARVGEPRRSAACWASTTAR